MKFEVIEPDEETIFKRLDNDMFWGDVKREDLEKYQSIEGETDVDECVRGALERVLNITLPDERGWYNGSKGRKK